MLALTRRSCKRNAWVTSRQLPFLSHAPVHRHQQIPSHRQVNFATSAVRQNGEHEITITPLDKKEIIATSRKLFGLAKPEAKSLSAAVCLLAISTGAGLMWPTFMGNIMDVATHSSQSASLLSTPTGIAAALCGLSTINSLAKGGQTLLLTIAGERISRRLRQRLFASIARQEVAFFDKHRTGELVSRLSADAGMAQNALTKDAANGLSSLFYLVGCIGMLFWISPLLSMVSLSAMPAAGVASVYFGRYIKERQKAIQSALADTTSKAEEVIANIRTVRQFTMEKQESRNYALETNRVFDIARQMAFVTAGYQGGLSLAWNVSLSTVVGFGGAQVVSGVMSPGDMTAFLMYSLYLAGSAHSIAGVYAEMNKAIGACHRVFQIIDDAPPLPFQHQPLYQKRNVVDQCAFTDIEDIIGKDQDTVAPMELRDKREFSIEFQHVKFSYPSRDRQTVLHDFTLTIAPGEHLALVGKSGSGKSTVASLLTRLYAPDSGTIQFNGLDIQNLSPDWLRQQIAVVAQEPVLFNTSIMENIRYGSPNASDDDVVAAAKEANVHTFIEAFPEGFATQVGERGLQLSGGQKQRIAIARAILKDPPIIVLDEATSALDAESEHLIQQAMERLSKNRSVISIAHRISTIKAADRIAMIDEGRIAELGSFDALIGDRGTKTNKFHALVQRQLQ